MTLQRYQKAQEPVEFDYKETEIGEVDHDPNGGTSDCPMPAGYFYFAHETPWPYEHGIKNELVLPIEEAEKLKAALEKPSVVTQDWQPIETAPYNTDVLAFDSKTKTMHVSWEGQGGWHDPDDHFYSEVGDCFKPTHWRPIPTPPTEE